MEQLEYNLLFRWFVGRRGVFTFAAAAYNLVRMRSLAVVPSVQARGKCIQTPIKRGFGHTSSANRLVISSSARVKNLRRVSFSSSC
jgi:hypothetical protein